MSLAYASYLGSSDRDTVLKVFLFLTLMMECHTYRTPMVSSSLILDRRSWRVVGELNGR